MNLLEVKKILEEIFNKEPMDGKKRHIVFGMMMRRIH